MPPDPERRLDDVLAAVRRRLAVRHTAEGLVVAGAAAAVIVVALGRNRWDGWELAALLLAVAVLAVGVRLWMRRSHRTRAAAACAIERANPRCRNVVITAEELRRHPDRVQPWMHARVIRDAAVHAEAADAAAAVPIRAVASAAVVSILIAAAAAAFPPRRAERVPPARTVAAEVPARPNDRPRLTVTLHPPAYIGGAAVTLTDPERVAALQGTRAHVRIDGGQWRLRFGDKPLPLRSEGGRWFTDVDLRESGYFALEPIGRADLARRLVPVLVNPDGAPVVRIEEPGRDLLLPGVRTIPVRASASDDHGLRAMSLRYTRVSGSGEQFAFVEGELPMGIRREEPGQWQAAGEVPLGRLGLEPGDSLVYRVVARDGREGAAGLASSDTFFIEIAGPGQVALEGFEMPPERERHALSQQMIVLKIERLRARERGLAEDALQEETASLAAEQRAVRANVVFLMGGHVEDEEEEAAHSHEIQEGRLENRARREVSRAVSHMTHAEGALAARDTVAALRQARLAVEALQRAFGARRYLLRALPARSRIDPTRRLSGSLDDADDWRREIAPSPDDPARGAARALMARLLALAPRVRHRSSSPELSADLAAAAERALRVDPADTGWQEVARRILEVRDAVASNAAREEIDRRLQAALDPVRARASGPAPAAAPLWPSASGLRSAWSEEMRR
jgi:hypothetical protein